MSIIGSVVYLNRTVKDGDTDEDAERIPALVVETWIADGIELRFLVAVLEPGKMDEEAILAPMENIDGCVTFRKGTLLSVTHRNVDLAPAPDELKQAVQDQHSQNREQRRAAARRFRPGEGWT